MRVDHTIFEVFRHNPVIGSYRAPPHWVEARAETRRGGVTRLQVRRALQAGRRYTVRPAGQELAATDVGSS